MSDAVGDQFLLLNETKQGIGNAILEKGGGYDMVPVEYLESTGTSVGNVINTHLKWDMTTAWEIDADFTGDGSCGAYWQWQERQGGRIRSFAGTTGITFSSGTASIKICGENSADNVTCVTATPGGRALYKFDPVARTASIGAVSATNIQFNDNWRKDGWLCLFGYGRPVSTSYPAMVETRMRIYGARFFKNGVMIRNYVPVVVNGVGYLYDRCQEKLCANDQSTTAPDYIVGSSIYDAEVEYLESTGTQYIDTGIVPSGATGITCDFALLNATENFSPVFWSRGTSATDRAFCFEGEKVSGDTLGQARWDYGNYGALQTRNVLRQGCRTRLWAKNGVLTVDGTRQARTAQTFTGAGSIILFNFCNYVDGERQMISAVCQPLRIYACAIYDDSNNLVRDLVPARKNGVGYMYDRVSNTLLGNAGTGDFLYGDDTGKGHLYDCEVEYLQSTPNGANTSLGHQYIDLSSLVDQTSGTYLKAEVKWCPLQKDNDRYIFGGGNVNRNWLGIYNNAAPVDFLVPNLGEYCKVFTAGNLIDNDITQGKCIVTTTTSTFSHIYAFCIYYNNGVYNPIKARLYYIKLYDANDKLIADLVPVRKGLEGYLYDRIGHGMYGNSMASHEAFVLGADIRKKVMPAKFSEYADAVDTIPTPDPTAPLVDLTDYDQTFLAFYDIDGNFLHSYSKAEVASWIKESDMPPVPDLSDEGYYGGEWNWDFSDVQTALQNNTPGFVGPQYMRSKEEDGYTASIKNMTEIVYEPDGTADALNITLFFADRSNIRVFWGDGDTTGTPVTQWGSTSLRYAQHSYASAGTYHIRVYLTSNNVACLSCSYDALIAPTSAFDKDNPPASLTVSNTLTDQAKGPYCMKYVKEVFCGKFWRFLDETFYGADNCTRITFALDYTNSYNSNYAYRGCGVERDGNRPSGGSAYKCMVVPKGHAAGLTNGTGGFCGYDTKVICANPRHVVGTRYYGFLFGADSLEHVRIPWTGNKGDNYVPTNAFAYLGKCQDVFLGFTIDPACSVGSNVFAYSGIRKIRCPNMINFTESATPNYLFDYCVGLEEQDFVDVSTRGNFGGTAMFRGCTNLFKNGCSLPKATSVGNAAFSNCKSAKWFDVGEAGTTTTLAASANFQNCTGALFFKFNGQVSQVPASCFNTCKSALFFDFSGCTSVPPLANANAFSNTMVAVNRGKIIVPDALYSAWIATTNWSSTTNHIVTNIIKASEAPDYSYLR